MGAGFDLLLFFLSKVWRRLSFMMIEAWSPGVDCLINQ